MHAGNIKTTYLSEKIILKKYTFNTCKIAKASLIAIIFCAISFQLQAQLVISTIAGNGSAAYGGDGGPATAAHVNTPYGVAVDAIGNVYIADYGNNRIRKIDTSGMISTIAGTGTGGFSGDGGPAIAAKIYGPRGITTDGSGNVFFSDYANSRIRKISVTGIITTIAGNGSPGFSGDGAAATAAQINFAWGVAVDAAGNLYMADQLNCRIRKVNTSGIISTICGTGIAFYGGDGGPAVAAKIQYPMGLAIDGPGNLYICDEGNCRIRKINTSGIISTVGGNGMLGFTGDGGAATSAKLYYPQGIALDVSGNMYIADLGNNRIRKINTSGVINTIIGTGTAGFTGDGGPPYLAEINQSTGVAVDAAGRVYIADNDNNRIRITHILSHAPFFTGGHHQNLAFCTTESVSLDSLLTVFDVDTGQTETWSVIVPALHGTVLGAYTTTSTGDTLVPAGLAYLVGSGYTGLDSFKVRVTDGTYSDTTTIYVNILTLPVAGVITGIDSLCPGHAFTFTDTAAGGTWSSSNTSFATVSATGLVTGIAPGTTTIIYSVTNVCGTRTASFPLMISAHCHTGINSLTFPGSDNIGITPNPAHGTFIVTLQDTEPGDARFIITNMTGEKIKEITAPGNIPFAIHIDAPAGIYFVSAITAAGKWEAKLVIVK